MRQKQAQAAAAESPARSRGHRPGTDATNNACPFRFRSGDAPPLLRSEYADDDQDGLANWFEMYLFVTFLDWNTATVADPKALGKDGKTNLQHYLDQTAPVGLPATGPSGKR